MLPRLTCCLHAVDRVDIVCIHNSARARGWVDNDNASLGGLCLGPQGPWVEVGGYGQALGTALELRDVGGEWHGAGRGTWRRLRHDACSHSTAQ